MFLVDLANGLHQHLLLSLKERREQAAMSSSSFHKAPPHTAGVMCTPGITPRGLQLITSDTWYCYTTKAHVHSRSVRVI